MKILDFGSINVDRVYTVPHFVEKGETMQAEKMEIFAGGKGLNQSIAAARAGAPTGHIGAVGSDGVFLRELLESNHVDVSHLSVKSGSTGHAIIQVTPSGANSIIILAGVNHSFTDEELDECLKSAEKGDIFLLQNETNAIESAMRKAHDKGCVVAFNASPMSDAVTSYPLDLVDIFLVNEIEGKILADEESVNAETIMNSLAVKYPNAEIVLTLGENGVLYGKGDQRVAHKAYRVKAVDTTGAGDTFCGYFLAGKVQGLSIEENLKRASLASACAVTRNGASTSIPDVNELEEFIKEYIEK